MAIQSLDAPLGDAFGKYNGVLGATRNPRREHTVSWANVCPCGASLDLGAERT